jgi:hypothetical protein
MGLWLILPFLTMFALRLANRDWRDPGVRFNLRGGLRWSAVAALVYPAVMLIVVGLALPTSGAGAAWALRRRNNWRIKRSPGLRH